MAAAAEAAGTKLGVDEVEPDDGFRAEVKTSKEGQAKTSQAEEEVVQELAAELTGDWHQLEGVARPPGAGPRLLAWNAAGHVAAYPKQLRVEVHPTEEKPIRVADYDGLQMASISEGGTCMAAGSKSTGGPRLLMRPAERWEKAVFSASLVGDEAPEAVACGTYFAAVLTSRRMLRLYTFSGMPIGLLSMPGRSVAMAASATLLFVVTRSLLAPTTTASEDDDILDFRVLETKKRVEVAAGRLPLSPAARLRWIGFSEDLVPMAIDTAGVVRALLGSGAGSWGPQSGCGAEWTPVLSLAQQEAELGPLWTVQAKQGAIVFAEVGLEAKEPQPQQEDAARTGAEVATGSEESSVYFGVQSNCQLRTIPWYLPLGAFPTGGDLIQTAFQEQLLSRHIQDMAAMDLLPESDSLEKRCKMSSLKLFSHLATHDEVERAHHVAQFVLASLSGSSKVLSMAQQIAEKANQYQLSDKVGAVPVKEVKAEVRQVSASVPLAARTAAPPLFAPGEFEEPEKPEAAPTPKDEDSQEPAKAPMQEPVKEPAQPTSGTPSTAGKPEAPMSTGPVASNPFARKRPAGAARAPHLLRDALGGSTRPATPMGSPTSGRSAKSARVS